MSSKINFQNLIDLIAQLEQDQSFYESELHTNHELQTVQHEEIIKLGLKLTKKFKKLVHIHNQSYENNDGNHILENLSLDYIEKFIDTIESYQVLIVPPKIFG